MEINGIDYSIGRLNAVDQFHVSRKIAPIVPKLMPIIAEVAKGDLTKTIAAIEAQNALKSNEIADDQEETELSEQNDVDVDLSDLEPLAEASVSARSCLPYPGVP